MEKKRREMKDVGDLFRCFMEEEQAAGREPKPEAPDNLNDVPDLSVPIKTLDADYQTVINEDKVKKTREFVEVIGKAILAALNGYKDFPFNKIQLTINKTATEDQLDMDIKILYD